MLFSLYSKCLKKIKYYTCILESKSLKIDINLFSES